MVLSTVRLEVLIAVKVKISVFVFMIPCNLLHGFQQFAGTNRNVHSVMSQDTCLLFSSIFWLKIMSAKNNSEIHSLLSLCAKYILLKL